MSRRFVFDTVFGDFFTVSQSQKIANEREEKLLGPKESRPLDRTDNEKTTDPFKYTPLYGASQDSETHTPLRLLDLLPGTRQDDIECRLRTTHLDACRDQYEALSYVWGDVSEPTPIQVDGATLQVGKNLRCALLNLRLEGGPRTLWVDAVCIDEENLDERARQVASMGDVYRSASRTVVWLGDSKLEETVLAYYTIEVLAEDAQAAKASGKSVAESDNSEILRIFRNETSVTEGLLRRPWWQRVWTAQEIMLAKKALIVCGRYQADWGVFCEAVYRGLALEVWEPLSLGTFATQDFVFFNSIDTLKNLPARDTPGEELLDYILNTRRRDATNPRDKIFAVFGLIDDHVGILPDYRSSPADVYADACAKIIQNTGNLDILGACFPFDKESAVKELPSWVPDWSPTSIFAQPLLNDANGNRRVTHASKKSRAKVMIEDQGRTLVVEGHKIDTITEISSLLRELDDSVWDTDIDFPEEKSLRDTLRDLGVMIGQAFDGLAIVVPHLAIYLEWEKFVRGLKPTNPDPRTADPMAIYWQTLCTGTWAVGTGHDETERLFWEWHKSLDPIRNLMKWKVNKAAGVFKSLGFIGYLKSTWHGYGGFFTLLRQSTERRLGSSARGYLCLLPKAARAGDELVLLRGGRVPVVLKPREDGCMTFVGEAYVHGIMDGWAFDEAKCREIRIR